MKKRRKKNILILMKKKMNFLIIEKKIDLFKKRALNSKDRKRDIHPFYGYIINFLILKDLYFY